MRFGHPVNRGLYDGGGYRPRIRAQTCGLGIYRLAAIRRGIAGRTALNAAQARKTAGLAALRERAFECHGYDCDWRILQAAQENIAAAGLSEFIQVACKPIATLVKPTHKAAGSGISGL